MGPSRSHQVRKSVLQNASVAGHCSQYQLNTEDDKDTAQADIPQSLQADTP